MSRFTHFFRRFFVTEKQTPQTVSLLECMDPSTQLAMDSLCGVGFRDAHAPKDYKYWAFPPLQPAIKSFPCLIFVIFRCAAFSFRLTFSQDVEEEEDIFRVEATVHLQADIARIMY